VHGRNVVVCMSSPVVGHRLKHNITCWLPGDYSRDEPTGHVQTSTVAFAL